MMCFKKLKRLQNICNYDRYDFDFPSRDDFDFPSREVEIRIISENDDPSFYEESDWDFDYLIAESDKVKKWSKKLQEEK